MAGKAKKRERKGIPTVTAITVFAFVIIICVVTTLVILNRIEEKIAEGKPKAIATEEKQTQEKTQEPAVQTEAYVSINVLPKPNATSY
jgi:signal transduction histidine kinase